MKPRSATLPAAERSTLLDRFRDVGLADQMMADLARTVKRKRRRKVAVRSVAALLLVGVSLAWAIPYARHTDSIAVPSAERRSLALEDGSRVELNANTKLSADFRYGRRTLRLTQGEAFFSVAKDESRPFLVQTSSGTVRVTGTQFNVRIIDGRAEVTLVEGKVSAEPASSAFHGVALIPGEQTTFSDAQPTVQSLAPSDVDRLLAWRRGQVVLDNTPLVEAVARFAAFHGKEITVDPALATLRLGGAYSLEDLPQFIEALKATGSVVVLPTPNGYRISPR